MFLNREDAGKQLGFALQKYKDKDVLVLGIPRGGVVTAYYVAQALNASLSIVIARKIGHPLNPELAIGAIAEDNSLYLTEYGGYGIDQETFNELKKQKSEEIAVRIKNLRKNRPLNIKNKTVILVDDGIATGATLFSIIRMCKNQSAKKIIVASPVASRRTEEQLKNEVDEIYILEKPVNYYAVSQVYRDFHEVKDNDVTRILEKRENELSRG